MIVGLSQHGASAQSPTTLLVRHCQKRSRRLIHEWSCGGSCLRVLARLIPCSLHDKPGYWSKVAQLRWAVPAEERTGKCQDHSSISGGLAGRCTCLLENAAPAPPTYERCSGYSAHVPFKQAAGAAPGPLSPACVGGGAGGSLEGRPARPCASAGLAGSGRKLLWGGCSRSSSCRLPRVGSSPSSSSKALSGSGTCRRCCCCCCCCCWLAVRCGCWGWTALRRRVPAASGPSLAALDGGAPWEPCPGAGPLASPAALPGAASSGAASAAVSEGAPGFWPASPGACPAQGLGNAHLLRCEALPPPRRQAAAGSRRRPGCLCLGLTEAGRCVGLRRADGLRVGRACSRPGASRARLWGQR